MERINQRMSEVQCALQGASNFDYKKGTRNRMYRMHMAPIRKRKEGPWTTIKINPFAHLTIIFMGLILTYWVKEIKKEGSTMADKAMQCLGCDTDVHVLKMCPKCDLLYCLACMDNEGAICMACWWDKQLKGERYAKSLIRT